MPLDPSLLVIGAAGLDRPLRLSAPLKPGARLVATGLDGGLGARLGGGGANAAVALCRAGLRVALVSIVPADPDGERALALLAGAGVDVSLVIRREGASRTTLILVDPDGERTILFAGPRHPPGVPPHLSHPRERPSLTFDGVLVRSAHPGAELWAAAATGPVVLHWPAATYRGPADVIVGSADDMHAEFLADPYAFGRARVGPRLQWVVVTDGERGATAYGASGPVHAPAPAVQVIDATGAGDVFAAGLLAALVRRAPIEAALRQACAWGAAAVSLDSSAPLDASCEAFPLLD